MKILVLSYPRSGTLYIQTALTSLGLCVGHEIVKKDGVVSWKHVAEPADLVLHQVRYPLDAINSFSRCKGTSRRYMFKIIGLKKEDGFEGRLLSLARAYLFWHDLISERKPIARYRVEDLPFKRTPFTDHGKTLVYKPPRLTFKMLTRLDKEVSIKLKELTEIYGYEVRNEDT